jgi:hypothetical protein
MSVESNRAKAKRFYERHPDYRLKKRERARLRKQKLVLETAQYQVFELADPRTPAVPRLISLGLITNKPVWKPFLDLREISRAPWAAWLCELAALSLEPIERVEWSIGRILPVSQPFGLKCVKTRIEQLNRLHTGSPTVVPLWLLHYPAGPYYYVLPAGGKPPQTRPLGFVKNSVVERFPSMSKAPAVPDTCRMASWCGTDRQGRTWFYD